MDKAFARQARAKLVESAEQQIEELQSNYHLFLTQQVQELNQPGYGVEASLVMFNTMAGEAPLGGRSDIAEIAKLAEELLELAPEDKTLEILGVCKNSILFAAKKTETLSPQEMNLVVSQLALLKEKF